MYSEFFCMNKILLNIANRYSTIVKYLLFLLSIVLLVLIFPKEGKFKYEYQNGKPWQYDELIAPTDFAITKSAKDIETEQNELLKTLKVYFNIDNTILQKKRVELDDQFDESWKSQYPGNNTNRNLNLSVCHTIFDTIAKKGIIESTDATDDQPSGYSIIVIESGNIAHEHQLRDFFDIQKANQFIRERMKRYPLADSSMLIPILQNAITYNILYNKNASEEEKKSAFANLSDSKGKVQQGQKIIAKGEIVNNEKFLMLESLRKEYEGEIGTIGKFYAILAGQIILITMSILVLVLFLLSFRRDTYNDNKKVGFILLQIILIIFITAVTINRGKEFIYILPICIIPIIIRAFFDTRLALFVHLVTIILIGFLVPNSYEFIFLQFITGILTIISIANLQKRLQFFRTALIVFVSYSTIYTGIRFIEEGSFTALDSFTFLLFAGSAILTLSAYPLIFLFERLFGFLTDISLMELADSNAKLLRELSVKAPGTFQHSLQIANMAEEVIYEIGGNPLLARTGAMYHDIGKMETPMYFSENQITGVNPHSELTHEESARIIIGHVIKGVEIARRNRIPDKIIDFIRTHHGIKRTEYFYSLYRQEHPDEDIEESRFTYKGPLPYSKETTVLMMADSIEATSKSIKNPEENTINDLVDQIIEYQMSRNQYVNSNITLKDITVAKKVFKRILMNRFHIRVAYPKLD